MLKKALVGIFLAGVVGAVIAGIVALADPTEHIFARQGERRGAVEQGSGYQGGRGGGGNGQNATSAVPNNEPGAAANGRGRQTTSTGNESNGAGNGRGRNRNTESPAEHGAWQTMEGVVIETAELVIETIDGDTVQVGLGPIHYRESQGFVLNVGDEVRVSGYREGDEFKAAQVENLSRGTQIVLRDTSGRPMWAGQGRRSG
jgi:hypothetical protein